jgi:hypothetical protein
MNSGLQRKIIHTHCYRKKEKNGIPIDNDLLAKTCFILRDGHHSTKLIFILFCTALPGDGLNIQPQEAHENTRTKTTREDSVGRSAKQIAAADIY